jgi:glycosyltransferase involved in cell wall biosynthesis
MLAAPAPAAPSRVLYVTTSLETLGPATAIVELAVRLDAARYAPAVVQLDRSRRGCLERRLEAAGVSVHSLGSSGPGAIRAIARLARRDAVRILQTRLIRADFLGRLAGRLAGVPLIITNMCDVYTRHFADRHGRRKGAWLSRLDRATLPLAHCIVTNADGIRDDLLEHGIAAAGRVRTIPNGVDTRRYRRDEEDRAAVRRELTLQPDAWVVGTVSRLSSKKRHDVLIDAFAIVLRERPAARLLVVGDGELRGMLERRAREAGLADAVRFLGARSDVPAVLSAMDAFAFPSEFEGCPNAVLEAMSCALPVVGADVPGTRELVRPGSTGRLVAPDDAGQLAAALMTYADPALARAAGLAGRAGVEQHFSLAVMADRFQAFYDEQLARRARS